MNILSFPIVHSDYELCTYKSCKLQTSSGVMSKSLSNQANISDPLADALGNVLKSDVSGEVEQSCLPPLKDKSKFGLALSSAAIPAICQKSALEIV